MAITSSSPISIITKHDNSLSLVCVYKHGKKELAVSLDDNPDFVINAYDSKNPTALANHGTESVIYMFELVTAKGDKIEITESNDLDYLEKGIQPLYELIGKDPQSYVRSSAEVV